MTRVNLLDWYRFRYLGRAVYVVCTRPAAAPVESPRGGGHRLQTRALVEIRDGKQRFVSRVGGQGKP